MPHSTATAATIPTGCRKAGPDEYRTIRGYRHRVARSPLPVIAVERHPTDPHQVIVTDTGRSRSTMTYDSYTATCWLAPDAVVAL
jgi:hypothetical protein